jgi:hypothetical protein
MVPHSVQYLPASNLLPAVAGAPSLLPPAAVDADLQLQPVAAASATMDTDGRTPAAEFAATATPHPPLGATQLAPEASMQPTAAALVVAGTAPRDCRQTGGTDMPPPARASGTGKGTPASLLPARPVHPPRAVRESRQVGNTAADASMSTADPQPGTERSRPALPSARHGISGAEGTAAGSRHDPDAGWPHRAILADIASVQQQPLPPLRDDLAGNGSVAAAADDCFEPSARSMGGAVDASGHTFAPSDGATPSHVRAERPAAEAEVDATSAATSTAAAAPRAAATGRMPQRNQATTTIANTATGSIIASAACGNAESLPPMYHAGTLQALRRTATSAAVDSSDIYDECIGPLEWGNGSAPAQPRGSPAAADAQHRQTGGAGSRAAIAR